METTPPGSLPKAAAWPNNNVALVIVFWKPLLGAMFWWYIIQYIKVEAYQKKFAVRIALNALRCLVTNDCVTAMVGSRVLLEELMIKIIHEWTSRRLRG